MNEFSCSSVQSDHFWTGDGELDKTEERKYERSKNRDLTDEIYELPKGQRTLWV